MAESTNYYEVLGVPQNAKLVDINRAYKRWVGEFKKDTTPPDARREALILEAYETLSDETRRDAYDQECAAELASARRKARGPALPIAIGVVVVAAAIGLYFGMREQAPTGPKPHSAQQIHQAMSASVSSLIAYDMSGKSTPVGAAFVIKDKVMVASCHALVAGAQLMVTSGAKQVPARVSTADPALGICKILTDGYVGEPIGINPTPPVAGAKVFTTSVNEKGDVTLQEATVTRVFDDAGAKAIQSSVARDAKANGTPLLDAWGKVVAVATQQADGKVLHRVIPAGWLEDDSERAPAPKPYQADPDALTTTASPATPGVPVPKGPGAKVLSSPSGLNTPGMVNKEIAKGIENIDAQADKK